MTVRVVTDSTAYLPTEVARSAGVSVVPLTVTVSGREGREGVDVSTDEVAQALGERRAPVTTSRPAPSDFTALYGRLLARGATGIVSVHLSARLSGTYDSARQAAREFDGQVVVIDSLTAGMGLGFVALAAARSARVDHPIDAIADAARIAVGRTSTLFYVDTLEFLRRGGRISAASALLGTALSVKPILNVREGQVVLREKVRTASRALARLADLAVADAGDSDVDLAVQHLGAPDRAAWLMDQLRERLGDRVGSTYLLEVGAVVAAHTGPGVLGVATYRRGVSADGPH